MTPDPSDYDQHTQEMSLVEFQQIPFWDTSGAGAPAPIVGHPALPACAESVPAAWEEVWGDPHAEGLGDIVAKAPQEPR